MKKSWLFLLTLLTFAGLWFCSKALYDLWRYSQISEHVPAMIDKWEIEERSPSKLFIVGHYSFELAGTVYKGETRFKEPQFLNRPSAESALGRFSSFSWSVWYAPKNPSISSLQRLFPYKSSLNGLITLSVIGYFYWRYLQTVSNKNRKNV